MIVKDLLTENGYTFKDPVTAEELQNVLKPILHEFKCMIVNKKTAKKYDLLNNPAGNRFITVNNNIPDDMMFVNRFC